MAEETSDTKNPEYISNPFVQKELYDLIEKVYFTNFTNQTVDQEKTSEYNDTADFELKNLDYESPDVKINVKNVIKKLQIQHEIVGRKLSDIILQNSQSYSKELKRVSDFKQVLEDSYQICRISRRSLSMCLNSYIYSQLRLLTRQSKKIQLIKLLETIEDIKGLTNITNNIIHLIGTRDYLQALNLCTKIEKSFEKYDHLRCIKGLKKTIEECYKLIEENSMASLLKSCRKYDESLFANACLSCQKLNNFKNFFQKLNENFVNTINNVSLQTLKRLIVSRRFPLDGNEISNQVLAAQVEKFIAELKQKNFANELFSLVIFDDYKLSLNDLCSNLWQIMKNFYSMSIWMHRNLDYSNDADYDKYIANIQRKIWEEVQIKISTYFRSMDLVNFKFDDYLDILVILNRFIELGNEFCNKASDCDIIIQAVKEQTLAYINFYHLSHLEELKMFLENEIWQCCPVRSDFSVFNLHEYKFLQSNEGQTPSDSVLELIEKNISSDLERSKANTFEINNNMVQLINISGDKKTKIDIFDEINLLKKKINSKNNESPQSSPTQSSDSVEDEFDEHLVQNFDAHNSINQEQPILTNTTLNIIRLFGKYIHMLSIFKIISFQVISYLMQLFQFYFYYIYLDFAQTDEIPTEQNDGSILNLIDKNSTLNTLFKNIKNDIFKKSKMSSPRMEQAKIVQNHDEYMDLVRQRIIATESLVYLSKLLENMFPLIKKILPMKQLKQNEINNLDIYTNILRETPKIRKNIYSYIARRAVDYNQLVDSIGRVNWDLNEILSQHNSYVDVLLRQLNDLKLDLQDLCAQIPLNKTIINSILEETLRLCMRVLVDGYSLVKKCSNEGRALMQLDFQQLVVKLEALFDIRPIPDKDYVETFIKAYYLPDSSIEKWVKDHPEYQQKNIAGLLGLMGQLSKKTRLAVLNSFQPGTLGSNNINAS